MLRRESTSAKEWGLAAGLALVLLVAAVAAEGQQAGKVYRLGYLSIGSASEAPNRLDVFRQGLRELGRLKVDVIVMQSGVAALAAKKATQTIPIVMLGSGDAVRQGLVASLARPGGNVTGLTMISPELSRKRLEILREMRPRLSRVGVLWCGGRDPLGKQQWEETQAAAGVLGVQLSSLEVRGAKDLASAFASAMKHRVQADERVVLDQRQAERRALLNEGRVQVSTTEGGLGPGDCGLERAEVPDAGGAARGLEQAPMQLNDLPQRDIPHQARRRYSSWFFCSTRLAATSKSSSRVARRSATAARARSSGVRPGVPPRGAGVRPGPATSRS